MPLGNEIFLFKKQECEEGLEYCIYDESNEKVSTLTSTKQELDSSFLQQKSFCLELSLDEENFLLQHKHELLENKIEIVDTKKQERATVLESAFSFKQLISQAHTLRSKNTFYKTEKKSAEPRLLSIVRNEQPIALFNNKHSSFSIEGFGYNACIKVLEDVSLREKVMFIAFAILGDTLYKRAESLSA